MSRKFRGNETKGTRGTRGFTRMEENEITDELPRARTTSPQRLR